MRTEERIARALEDAGLTDRADWRQVERIIRSALTPDSPSGPPAPSWVPESWKGRR